MGDMKIGYHDTGMWDIANDLKVSRQPKAQDLEPDQAIEQAKASPGAELVLISRQGKASIHSLSIDKGLLEGAKQIKVGELSPMRVPDDLSKTPLVIEQDPAGEFGAMYSFVVDDDKNVAMGTGLGPRSVLAQAIDTYFLDGSGQQQAAYLLAQQSRQKPQVFDAMVARQIGQFVTEGKFSVEQARSWADKIRDPGIKAKLQSALQQAAGVESSHQARMQALETSLAQRTSSLDQQVSAATETLGQAGAKWKERHAELKGQVDRAQTTYDEARVPGIRALEQRESKAERNSETRQSAWSRANQDKLQDESRVARIEQAGRDADSLRQELSSKRQALENRKDQFVNAFSRSLTMKQAEMAAIGIGALISDEGMTQADRRRVDELQTQMLAAQQVINELRIWNRNSPSTLTQIIGGLSMDFFDTLNMSMYVSDVRGMESGIRSTESQLSNAEHNARGLSGARSEAAASGRAEASARAELEQARQQLSQVQAEIAERRAAALPETAPAVKSAQAALSKAQQRFEAEVGSQGSLTQSRAQAQTSYDGLHSERSRAMREGQDELRRQREATSQTYRNQLTGQWQQAIPAEFRDLHAQLPN